MSRPQFIVLISLLLIGGLARSPHWPAAAQQTAAQSLNAGEAVARNLAGGESQAFRFTLAAGQFALVQAEQQGIDLRLCATVNGQESAVDVRAGTDGVERLFLLAEQAAEYRLTVTPRQPQAAPGQYTITLLTSIPSQEDRLRARAQQLCQEAQTLASRAETKPAALQKYEEALLLWQNTQEQEWRAHILPRMGKLAAELGDAYQAKNYFTRAVTLSFNLNDKRNEAAARYGVCQSLNYLVEPRQVLECFDALLPQYRTLDDPAGQAQIFADKAQVLTQLGDYGQAVEIAQKALKLFEAAYDRRAMAQTLHNLGAIHQAANQLPPALASFQRALVLRRELKDARQTSETLTRLAQLHLFTGEDARALTEFNEALTLSEDLGDQRMQAELLQTIGTLYAESGAGQQALSYLQKSAALLRNQPNRQSESRVLTAIARVQLDLEQPALAAQSAEPLRRAHELARLQGDRITEANALLALGRLAARNGDAPQATEQLRQARELAQQTGNWQTERDALVTGARLAYAQGDARATLAQLESALALNDALPARLTLTEQRASARAARQRDEEFYLAVLMQQHAREPQRGYAATALRVHERLRAQRAFAAVETTRATLRTDVPAELLLEERQVNDALRRKEEQRQQLLGDFKTAPAAAALTAEIASLTRQYESLQMRLRTDHPRYAALTQPAALAAEEIQLLLDADTVLVEYALGQEQSYVWVVTAESLQSFALPPAAQIESAARRVLELLPKGTQERQRRETYAALQQLSRMLYVPFAAQMNKRRLAIVGDGILAYVPFAALPVSFDAKLEAKPAKLSAKASPAPATWRMLDRTIVTNREIIALPSASALRELRRATANRAPAAKQLAVLADPVLQADDPRLKTPTSTALWPAALREAGVSGFVRLPQARQEADAVAAAARREPAMRALDFTASRATVFAPSLSEYRYLHFAAPVWFHATQPDLSGLVLSLADESGQPQDGVVRFGELYNLQLNADLVTLSGSRALLGPPAQRTQADGLLGAVRGFWHAGTPRVLVSLWDVDGAARAEFMQQFYQALLVEQQRPAAALRAAQLKLRANWRYAEPYYWAGFALLGDWR